MPPRLIALNYYMRGRSDGALTLFTIYYYIVP